MRLRVSACRILRIPFRAGRVVWGKGILRLRLFFALIAQRTILAQDDKACWPVTERQRRSCSITECLRDEGSGPPLGAGSREPRAAGPFRLSRRLPGRLPLLAGRRELAAGPAVQPDCCTRRQRLSFGTEHNLHDDVELLRLRGIRIRGDDNLLIVENAREGDDPLGEAGDSEVDAIARERTKIEPSVAQC